MPLGKSLGGGSESAFASQQPPHLCQALGEELYQHRDHSSMIILIIQQTHRSKDMGGEDRL